MNEQDITRAVKAVLEEMEEKNRIAHEGTTLTHLPLSELALLNDL